jgi:hypothetical protein
MVIRVVGSGTPSTWPLNRPRCIRSGTAIRLLAIPLATEGVNNCELGEDKSSVGDGQTDLSPFAYQSLGST